MRHSLLLILLLMVGILPATAQSSLVVRPDTVEFGVIREAEGEKSVRVYAVNGSDSPLSIVKVRPSCGCTAANFMKGEIMPGDSAWIDLTYDPVRRPGRFEKTVRVYSSDGDNLRVPITGVVLASPATVELMFPADGGLVRLSESTFMALTPLDVVDKSFFPSVYNPGEEDVWMLVESDDEAASSELFPAVLEPGDRGMIGLYINPRVEKRSGNLEYTFRLYTAHDPARIRESEPAILKVYTEK